MLDAYRRLLTMYGDVVLERAARRSSRRSSATAREAQGAANDAELTPESLRGVVGRLQGASSRSTRQAVPAGAARAALGRHRRRLRELEQPAGPRVPEDRGDPGLLGTAVNVQAMVFGNRGDDCATGVAFTRNPATGERRVYGEYLINAQGEDVVAGIRTPKPIVGGGRPGRASPRTSPRPTASSGRSATRWSGTTATCRTWSSPSSTASSSCCRRAAGKRTGPAAVRIAVEMVEEGLIDQREALGRVQPSQLAQMLAPEFDAEAEEEGGRRRERCWPTACPPARAPPPGASP